MPVCWPIFVACCWPWCEGFHGRFTELAAGGRARSAVPRCRCDQTEARRTRWRPAMELFEAQVAAHPSRYRRQLPGSRHGPTEELNAQQWPWGRHDAVAGLQPDQPVALLRPSANWSYWAWPWAVSRPGLCLLPLDPNLPDQRLADCWLAGAPHAGEQRMRSRPGPRVARGLACQLLDRTMTAGPWR